MSASCYLSKAGFDVTILEKNNSFGGRARQFKKDGFTFDIGPSWYWMPDIFENFFNDFNEKRESFYDLEKRVKNKWVFDIDKIATEKSQFWIDNRKYIQKDKYLKYNLLKRIELWEQIIGQLDEYTIEVNSNIEYLDSIILDKEKEIKIVYWVFRPQDIGLR